MDVSKSPKSVYLMLKNLDNGGYIIWVKYIREILYKCGLGIVYTQQHAIILLIYLLMCVQCLYSWLRFLGTATCVYVNCAMYYYAWS